ncbi:hypothetical protein [Streptomyces sp. NRRL B-24484]|uniref:hypothetical protein n=1 Tax=Streptomyces sp. NRRL B-24484 TaxID=1463833 RepID=UPI001331BF51|nr:hypothetical protein [Streptomyces sp. NRRL B-24484]
MRDLIAALIIRDFVQDGTGALDAALRSRFEVLLSESDNLFTSFTEPDELLRVEGIDACGGQERGWWWQRIPVSSPAREEEILHSDLP